MANIFKDISQFTLKSAATGTEEFQVSATEKVTSLQVANLFKAMEAKLTGFNKLNSGIPSLSASNTILMAFQNLYQLVGAGRVKVIGNKSNDFALVAIGETNGLCYGVLFSVDNDDRAIYTRSGFQVTGIAPSNVTDDQWITALKAGKKMRLDDGIPIIEVGDFTMINEVWPAKQVPGSMCAFYTGSDVYSQPEATEVKYVGFIILDSDFSTNKQATVVAFAKTSGKQYIGRLEFEGQEINWFTNVNLPVTVTDFKSLPNSVKNAKDGEIIPIIAPSSASNGPTGLVSTGPAYGYVQVAKTGSTKAYNFLVQMDSAGNGPRMYTGFVNTVANFT